MSCGIPFIFLFLHLQLCLNRPTFPILPLVPVFLLVYFEFYFPFIRLLSPASPSEAVHFAILPFRLIVSLFLSVVFEYFTSPVLSFVNKALIFTTVLFSFTTCFTACYSFFLLSYSFISLSFKRLNYSNLSSFPFISIYSFLFVSFCDILITIYFSSPAP